MPKDVSAIVTSSEDNGYSPKLLKQVLDSIDIFGIKIRTPFASRTTQLYSSYKPSGSYSPMKIISSFKVVFQRNLYL